MSNENDIKEVEISIDQAKAAIKRGECLSRLEKNPDWKELITEGYLQKQAVRQVMVRASTHDPRTIADCDQQIIAIGQFNQYLMAVAAMGSNAAAALVRDENTLEELLQEGIDNE
jgi:hypothetical protein